MTIHRDLQLDSNTGRPLLFDLYYREDGRPKPLIIFAHGFKGFKDWGHWDLIARTFAEEGFAFLKFNFSFNGTTPAQPLDFADLEAFGNNNYSRELTDLDTVLNWLYMEPDGPPRKELSLRHLCLIGHSRGGGISIIKANLDDRIAALITWASVNSLAYAWPGQDFISEWKEKGVYYAENSRTKQQMPLYFQLYQDFQTNKDMLDVEKAVRQLHKPFLIIHGTHDPAVPPEAARQLNRWNEDSELYLIDGADHVFGGRHPYPSAELPVHTQMLTRKCIDWLNVKFSEENQLR